MSLSPPRMQPKTTSGPMAQRLAQRTHNPLVVGSNPTGPTKKYLVDPKSYRIFVVL
jgi:hypothetical protein